MVSSLAWGVGLMIGPIEVRIGTLALNFERSGPSAVKLDSVYFGEFHARLLVVRKHCNDALAPTLDGRDPVGGVLAAKYI